jgi:hypothetical protein
MSEDRRQLDRFAYIGIFWEGPWCRLGLWLIGIDRNSDLKFEVKPGSLRDRLADWADRRDIAWKRRWAARDGYPPEFWRRRSPR